MEEDGARDPAEEASKQRPAAATNETTAASDMAKDRSDSWCNGLTFRSLPPRTLVAFSASFQRVTSD